MEAIQQVWTDPKTTPIDFIIVGAGAGGAPLASRLAERGFQVLVVEMGPKKPAPPSGATVDCVDVPLLHSETTEDKRHSLRFFVDHFDGVNERRNPRRHPSDPPDPNEPQAIHPEDEHGVFYPRAQGLGGCTIHNAMIAICGPSEDWDEIAEEMRDPSWRGESMRSYFERLEHCNYDRSSLLGKAIGLFKNQVGWKSGRHGHGGWLQTTMSNPGLLLNEKKFLKIATDATLTALEEGIETVTELKAGTFPQLDPNHWEIMRRSLEGVSQIPCSITATGERSSPRERLLATQARQPDRLHTLTGVFVTGLLFRNDDTGKEVKDKEQVAEDVPLAAIGVKVLAQEHVYEADVQAEEPDPKWEKQQEKLYCKREVILCGGSFNTPQLLMLSGIGPQDNPEEFNKHIPRRRTLPAVGQYLQDRYEVPIVATLSERFESLDSLGLSSTTHDDPMLKEWRENRGLPPRKNPYATNGGLIGIFKRSEQEFQTPDLFMFALAGRFPGYQVGWSRPSELAPEIDSSGDAANAGNESRNTGRHTAAKHKRSLTWLILKARSRNATGTVKLRSHIPFRRPYINFNVLPNAEHDSEDVKAIYEGVQFVEKMLARNKKRGLIESYEFPGDVDGELNELSDSVQRAQRIKTWIKDVAWGHHACGTCRMGRSESNSVVDHRFKVHNVAGLRVVDASIFPRIPGYFIVTNIYMISEKAADVISEDHQDHLTAITDPVVLDNLREAPIFHSSEESKERLNYPVEMEDREAKLIRERRKRNEADRE